jgi:hypothetical protein
MRVFLSWSGEQSHGIARALYDWIPILIQSAEPFLSSEEIDKGTRWGTSVAGELSRTNFGIICLTAENLGAPWVLFEAGALAKVVDQSRVAPILFGVKVSEVQGPLAQFQLTNFDKSDMERLFSSINAACEDSSLDQARLARAFEAIWPELEKKIKSIPAARPASPTKQANTNDILEEILSLTRQQSVALNSPELATTIARNVSAALEASRRHGQIPGDHPAWSDLAEHWTPLYRLLQLRFKESAGALGSDDESRLIVTHAQHVNAAVDFLGRRFPPRRRQPHDWSKILREDQAAHNLEADSTST